MQATATETAKLKRQIRNWTIFFMVAISLSGITAFPIQTELEWLNKYQDLMPGWLSAWVTRVADGVVHTNMAYPFIMYGTDWLAFAHIIIAMLFIGVLRDPVRNKWIIEWAMICCILVFPLAFIMGPIRGIPFYHQLIDCGFGVVGLVPLAIVRGKVKQLEN
jgi:hypothetical protein